MVDLRVDMVGTAGQHDTAAAALFQIFYDFLALRLHVHTGLQQLVPRGVRGLANLSGGDLILFVENLYQTLRQDFLIGKCHEGIDEANVLLRQRFDVVFDIFRVGSYDRTVVVVVRLLLLVALIWNAGVEDGLYAVLDEPFHVTVRQLRRVALRLTGDGFDAQLVDLTGRCGRKHHMEFQRLKEGGPERVVLVLVQNARNTDHAAGRFLQRKRFVAEETLVLIGEQVRNARAFLLLAQALFTAVSADIATTAREMVDGQTAGVGTAAAARHGRLVFEIDDVVEREHGGLRAFHIALAGNECRAERAHDAGDVRTHGLAAGDALEAAEHGVVIERTTLNDDVFTQILRIGQLDHFIECVSDDRIRQTRGDVCHIGAFLLGLFYVRIHEYGTAGTEVGRMLCEQSRLREILHRVIQRFGECLDKRTAAGGACLVQKHAVDRVVFDLDALHVLAADIEDTVDLGQEEFRRVEVSDGFDLAFVEHQRRLQKRLTVAGGAGVGDVHIFGDQFADLRDRADRRRERITVVGTVETVEQATFFGDQRHLRRGGTGVDAEEAIALISRQIVAFYTIILEACAEAVVLLLIAEQGLHTLNFEIHLDALRQTLDQVLCVQDHGSVGEGSVFV